MSLWEAALGFRFTGRWVGTLQFFPCISALQAVCLCKTFPPFKICSLWGLGSSLMVMQSLSCLGLQALRFSPQHSCKPQLSSALGRKKKSFLSLYWAKTGTHWIRSYRTWFLASEKVQTSFTKLGKTIKEDENKPHGIMTEDCLLWVCGNPAISWFIQTDGQENPRSHSGFFACDSVTQVGIIGWRWNLFSAFRSPLSPQWLQVTPRHWCHRLECGLHHLFLNTCSLSVHTHWAYTQNPSVCHMTLDIVSPNLPCKGHTINLCGLVSLLPSLYSTRWAINSA